MGKEEEELDRVFDMFVGDFLPKPLRVLIILLIILFSLFYGSLLALIDKILEKSSRK